jgi:hypothetical protein
MPDAADCRSIEGLLVCADTSEREDFVEIDVKRSGPLRNQSLIYSEGRGV